MGHTGCLTCFEDFLVASQLDRIFNSDIWASPDKENDSLKVNGGLNETYTDFSALESLDGENASKMESDRR